jgi:hypothetical protein
LETTPADPEWFRRDECGLGSFVYRQTRIFGELIDLNRLANTR